MTTPTPGLATVLHDVTQERVRQIAKGWTPEHDDPHTTWEFILLTEARLSKADDAAKSWPSDRNIPLERKGLVEAAALLVAAIERLDREVSRG